MSDDRTVHATCETFEVVRYDRAGKWYVEEHGGPTRYHIGVFDAAQRALSAEALGGRIFPGLPGGRSFDQKVRILRARHHTPAPVEQP